MPKPGPALPPPKAPAPPMALWRRPATVAVVVALAAIAGALLYAGPGAAGVLYCLIVDGAIALAWLAAAAGWGSWPARFFLKGRDPGALLGGVTTIALGLGIISHLTLGVGLAGALNRVSAIALLAIGWLMGFVWLWRQRQALREYLARRKELSGAEEIQLAWRWLWLLTAPALAISLVAAAVPPGLLWKPEEPLSYDAVEYHLEVPREWFELGRIVPLQHNVFSYFPFGVEMHYLLAMHVKGGPWAAMYLTQLMHLAMMGLAVAAAVGFARRLGADRRLAIIAGVAMATVPWLAQLAPLAFNEGGLLLFGTLCIGWSLWLVRELSGGEMLPITESNPSPLKLAALAGVMAGFAASVKLTGVPLFLLAAPLSLLIVSFRRSTRIAIAASLVIGLAGSLVFAPWLIRNSIWCGNPVFPEGLSLFGKAHFTDAQVVRFETAHAPRPDQQALSARLAEFASQVVSSWQFGFALLPLAVLGVLLGFRRRPDLWMLAILLALHAVFWIGMTHLQGRFFTPAIPIAILAISIAPWGKLFGGRTRHAAALIAGLVAVAAIIGFWNVDRRLWERLHEWSDVNGMDLRSVILASPDINFLTLDIRDNFAFDDPNAKLLLVGDAQAFWYPLPMTRLRYRTVFDVPQGPEGDVFTGYEATARDNQTWMRIDTAELKRFARTYQPFPTFSEMDEQALRGNSQSQQPILIGPPRK